MRFLFTKVFADDPETYVSAKLSAIHKEADEQSILAPSTQAALVHQDHPDLALMPEDGLPDIPEDQAADFETAMRCARFEASAEIPRLPGETIQSERFTYLTAPLGDIAAGTGALVRTTNQAELTILFPEVRIIDGRLVRDERYFQPDSPDTGAVVSPMIAGIDDLALEAASAIASKIAAKIGEKIGDKIYESIFGPEDVPSYFSEVYKKLHEMFKQEIDGSVISQINGHVNGFRGWLEDEFIPMRASGRDRDTLLGLLDDWQEKFAADVIGPLEEKRFRKAGLPVYQLAGSTVLLIDTIQAEVDVGEDGDVLKSSYTMSRKSHAERFADHVTKTYYDMLNDIENSVEVLDHTIYNQGSDVCTPNGCHTAKGTTTPQYEVFDHWTGYKSGDYWDKKNGDPWTRAKAERDGIVKKRRTEAKKAIGGFDPKNPTSTEGPIVGDWRKIAGYTDE
ncbi:hypothetical protein KZZ07_13050 [Mameliella sp. CS4]|uniref:hypothetical protein n=1 Tax=Mameliella sp. CS4 TaxID=2862329 RepID=UPI001C5DACB9|nr:hypothetical protein [Mameliella sp. CS4]MBW4983469.1 hypothetical protein [Mameliella sp. CS4]